VEVALSMGGVAYVTNLADPFSGGVNSTASRTEGNLSMEVAATLPEGLDVEQLDGTADLLRALDAGLAVRVGVANGAGTQVASVQGFPLSYRYESTVEPGEGMATFDRSGLLLTGSLGGGTITVTSPDLPVPSVDATYGPLSADLRLPFGPEPGDFRYGFSFEDVSLSDAAWDTLDPQGAFPRDPLSFRLDLGGRLAIDLAATAQAEEAGLASPPPVVESVELRALELSGAGLRLSADGRLDFDPPSPEPLPGSSGTVRLEGVNRFLDAVVAMGWAEPGDLLPVRAGLAGFFRETAPDVREATIEVREGGAVFANGVQIQ
jgi:hypothetical protein